MVVTFSLNDKKENVVTKKFSNLDNMANEIFSDEFEARYGEAEVKDIIVNNEAIPFYGSSKDLYNILRQVDCDILKSLARKSA